MAGELLIFDAAASNIDGTDPGSALNLGPGTNYAIRELSAPAPPQTLQWAGSADTEGTLPASRKHENRLLSVTVLCSTAAALRSLQGKIGKIAREGGTLKWVLPNAETVIFDLHSADTFEPTITKLLYVRAGAFCEVKFSVMAKPYGRGASVTLSGHTASDTKAPLVFTETGIKGDMPALGSLTVDNATNAKTFAAWGIRSRYYSSATTAALFYGAETGIASSAALNAGYAGASGAGGNKVMRHLNVGSGSISYYVSDNGVTQALTHVGVFRVFARVQADSANTGTVSLRIQYAPGFGTGINGDWIAIQDSAGVPVEGAWVILDLGEVRIPPALRGSQATLVNIGAMSTVGTDDVDIDWLAFVPVDESTGRVVDTAGGIGTTDGVGIAWNGVRVRAGATTVWKPPQTFEGDYLLIPPAGAEARTLEVIVFLAGVTAGVATDTVISATNLDAIVATLTYTPRYLVVPEP